MSAKRIFLKLAFLLLLLISVIAKAGLSGPIMSIQPIGCPVAPASIIVYQYGTAPTCQYVVTNESTGVLDHLKLFPAVNSDPTIITPTVLSASDHCTGQSLTPAGTGATSQCSFTVSVGFATGSPGGQTILSPVVCLSHGEVCSNTVAVNRIPVIALGGQTGQPTITSISPAQGYAKGGDAVTITGQNVAVPSAEVTIDGLPAPITGQDPVAGTITVTTPVDTHSGLVNVTITTAGGLFEDPQSFTYLPWLTSVNPAIGHLGGGDTVTVTGNGLLNTDHAVFDTTSVVLSNQTATSATATTPAHAAGAVNLTVKSNALTSNIITFTYLPLPTITGFTPIFGETNTASNPTVTVTGTNFVPGHTTVDFGAAAGTNVVVAPNGQSLTVTPPSNASAGPVSLKVTTPVGNITAGQQYTYYSAPTITPPFSPAAGPFAGGGTTTITGTNFIPGHTTVDFGGTPATINSIAPDGTALTVTIPSATVATQPTPVTVTVTTSFGNASGTYTYDPVPSIFNINPSTGPAAGGNVVNITGSNFTSGSAGPTTVTFGGNPGTEVTVSGGGGLLTVKPPAGSPGLVDVVVTTRQITTITE